MTYISRRRFLQGAGFSLLALRFGLAPANLSAQQLPIGYGYALDKIPARRSPDINARPFGYYSKGCLVRYIPSDQPGWGYVIQDTQLLYPRRPRAHGNIYVPLEMLDLLTYERALPLPFAAGEQRVIEVSLSDQHLWAWTNGQLFLETPVSTGRKGYATPTGTFTIKRKRWSRYMQGVDESGPWDIPFIPTVQYIRGAVAIHGTYWHTNFGRRMSHGCINVPISEALQLYRFTAPAHWSFDEEQIVSEQEATVVVIRK